MTRIGLLSDTHSFWDDKYLAHFEQCDEIWHAGDIGSLEVAQKLSEFRPFQAVYGNCDGGDLRRFYSEKLRWKCEDAEILMTHIGGYPGKYDFKVRKQLYERPPHLFISGHSHILKVQFDPTLNLLHINPGAAGLQGWHKVRTLVRFTIDGQKFKDLEVVEINR
ncbi:MAG: metallophosphoesterase family protein [Paraprevotella sp.]|jgi:putative phosphoesterase|nr:metallophosphoesterase family protein [Paraprevotella sp.]